GEQVPGSAGTHGQQVLRGVRGGGRPATSLMASGGPGTTSPFGRPIVIADLSEETGRVREELPGIERKLGSMGLDPVVIRAETTGSCEQAARDALQAGSFFVVACGGDRAVHYLANGLFENGRPLHPEA